MYKNLPKITYRSLSSGRILLQASREDLLLNSIPSRSKEIQDKLSDLQNKADLLRLKQRDELDQLAIENSKPKLGDFKIPLLNTFLVASTVYLLLQMWYTSMETEEVLKEYQADVKALENDIQVLLNEREAADKKKSGWFSWLWR